MTGTGGRGSRFLDLSRVSDSSAKRDSAPSGSQLSDQDRCCSDETADTSLGFDVGGGMEYFTNRRVTVTAEFLYHDVNRIKTPLTTSGRDPVAALPDSASTTPHGATGYSPTAVLFHHQWIAPVASAASVMNAVIAKA